MTSSLVGSEMCIRDSVLLGHVQVHSAAALRHLAWVAACDANHQEKAAIACLLYTSDAADDM
eukprot:3150290-Prorocentrum_lima.AAC.1